MVLKQNNSQWCTFNSLDKKGLYITHDLDINIYCPNVQHSIFSMIKSRSLGRKSLLMLRQVKMIPGWGFHQPRAQTHLLPSSGKASSSSLAEFSFNHILFRPTPPTSLGKVFPSLCKAPVQLRGAIGKKNVTKSGKSPQFSWPPPLGWFGRFEFGKNWKFDDPPPLLGRDDLRKKFQISLGKTVYSWVTEICRKTWKWRL